MLQRPEHRLATGMSEADVEGFLATFASAAEGGAVHFLWRPQLRHPKDQLVLEAAVDARAGALVNHTVRDFQAAARLFKLRVMLPRELLKELEP